MVLLDRARVGVDIGGVLDCALHPLLPEATAQVPLPRHRSPACSRAQDDARRPGHHPPRRRLPRLGRGLGSGRSAFGEAEASRIFVARHHAAAAAQSGLPADSTCQRTLDPVSPGGPGTHAAAGLHRAEGSQAGFLVTQTLRT